MSLKDKFAQSYARSKTMSAPEKKANEIMGKILLKKAIIPLILMFVVIIVGSILKVNGWLILGINLAIAVATFFYIKNAGQKYQNFKPYVGNLISLEKKGKNEYLAIIKQGKLPIKLEISYGGEDLEHVKKNQLVQISYNPDAKIAIVVSR
jgi:low affinity Fe/Cu permease